VLRALDHRLPPRNKVELDLLRRGVDGISPPRSWALAC
jgi:hypothetical protein